MDFQTPGAVVGHLRFRVYTGTENFIESEMGNETGRFIKEHTAIIKVEVWF